MKSKLKKLLCTAFVLCTVVAFGNIVRAAGVTASYDATNKVLTFTISGNDITIADSDWTDYQSKRAEVKKIVFTGAGNDMVLTAKLASMTELEEVVFDDSLTVKTLGAGAFQYDTKLTKFELPDGLVTIGNYAFQNCPLSGGNDKTLIIPATVTSIGAGAFTTNNAQDKSPTYEKLVFEEGGNTVAIAAGAFNNTYTPLKEIYMPESYNVGSNSSFKIGSSSIPDVLKVVFPGNVPRKADGTWIDPFYGKAKIAFLTADSVSEADKTKLWDAGWYLDFCEPYVELGTVDKKNGSGTMMWGLIPGNPGDTYELRFTSKGGTVRLNYGQYNSSSNIHPWTVGGKMDKIKKVSFAGLKDPMDAMDTTFKQYEKLEEIDLAGKVQFIWNSAFRGCTSLKSAPDLTGVTKLGGYTFYNCLAMTGKLTIPNTITTVDVLDFGLSKLTEVEFASDSTAAIGKQMFENCKSLTKVTLSNSLPSIGDKAFYDCPLSGDANGRIVIPASVESIGESAFEVSTVERSYTGLDFENSGTRETVSIGANAFKSSKGNLNEIQIPENCTIGSGAFDATTNNGTMYITFFGALPWNAGSEYSPITLNAATVVVAEKGGTDEISVPQNWGWKTLSAGIEFYDYFDVPLETTIENGECDISPTLSKLVIKSGVSDRAIEIKKNGTDVTTTTSYDSNIRRYIIQLQAGTTLEEGAVYKLLVDGEEVVTLNTGDGVFTYTTDITDIPKLEYLNTTTETVKGVLCLTDGVNIVVDKIEILPGSVGEIPISTQTGVTGPNKKLVFYRLPDSKAGLIVDNNIKIDVFDTENKTTIEGDLGIAKKEKTITIIAMKKNLWDTADVEKTRQAAKWAWDVTTDAKGKFKLENVEFSNVPTDEYEFLLCDRVDTYSKTKSFGKYTDTQTALGELKLTADTGILTKIAADRNKLEFDYPLFDNNPSIQEKTALYVCENLNQFDANDKKGAVGLFRQYTIMAALANNKLADIKTVDEDIKVIEDVTEINKWYNDTNSDISDSRELLWKSTMSSLLSNQSFADLEDFETKFKTALAFAVVKNPESNTLLEDFLTDFAALGYIRTSNGGENSVLGCDEINEKAVKTIAGNTYTTLNYDTLISDIRKANTSTDYTPPSGGGGGGGGMPTIVEPKDENVTDNESETIQGEDTTVYLFDDMKEAAWANEAVEALAAKGIISGKGNGSFAPNDNITREEFTKIVVELGGFETEHGDFAFTDVSTDDWCYRYIKAAHKNGIINGISENIFGKGQNITRQDLAVILVNCMKAKGIKTSEEQVQFKDAEDISDYAQSATAILVKMGAVGGYEDGTFRPQGMATRAEAAKIIYAVLNLFD